MRTNHGGVAAIAVPGVQLSLVDLGVNPGTFELLCVRIVSMVLMRLDYGIATLAGLPDTLLDRLQSVLDAAAHLIHSVRKYDYITPLLCDLHWLRVPERIARTVWQYMRTAVNMT